MTYNERVRSIAEEMAKKRHAEFSRYKHKTQQTLINGYLPLAEIAVRLMGEAFDEGYDKCFYDTNQNLASATRHKHDLGLIKPTSDDTIQSNS